MAIPPKSILITGASGFIGGELVKAFRIAGWNVTGIGRRSLSINGYLSCDLSQPISMEVIERLRGIDVVLHAAARSSPWGSKKQFESDNVNATRNVLELAKQVDAAKVIFLSSSSVYYQPCDQLQISESTPPASPAVNLYAASKQRCEQLVRQFSGRWCILRPRAVYGVGDSVLFPRILRAAQAGRLPMLIRDGAPAIGDLLSVTNLVNVCVACASQLDIQGEFNLTDDHPVEINSFLFGIFETLGIPMPRRKLSTKTAFRMAGGLEAFYRCFLPNVEPPITKFGVHVFAYSKTFDVTKMKQAFGPPKESVTEAVQRFTEWVSSDEDPYGVRKQ